MRATTTRKALVVLAIAAGAAAAGVWATSTLQWEVAGFENIQKGTFEGTVATSSGEVAAGLDTVRREMTADAGIWSFVEGPGGDVFLGTGNMGALYLLRGDKVTLLTETESVALTALAMDKKGNLYAGGMPGAEIYRFTPDERKKLLEKAAKEAVEPPWKKRDYKSDKDKNAPDEEKKPEAGAGGDAAAGAAGKGDGAKQEPPVTKPVAEKKPEEKKPAKAKKEKKGKKGEEKKGDAAKAGEAPPADGAAGEKKEEPAPQRTGPEPWAKLEKADQVWSLLFDGKRGLLFAGTGPKGEIFTVDPTARVVSYVETKEEHVFSLALLEDGKLLAGTGNSARLILVEGAGRGSVAWDYDATEVKGIALFKDPATKKNVFVCAVNRFKDIPPISVPKPSLAAMTKLTAKQPFKGLFGGSGGGEGFVSAIFEGEGARTLMENKGGQLTFMEPRGGDRVVVGEGQNGRVYEVDLEGNYSVLFDLEDRQVLSFCLDCANPFIGTSDPAAVYRVMKKPPEKAYYVSDVLDAGFPAQWGQLVLRAKGKVGWQTRTGNTSKPDRWWSDWSDKSFAQKGAVASPAARFMQFRLDIDPGAQVWNVREFYLPANQQAIVKEVTALGADKGKSGGKPGPDKHDPIVKNSWKVDNPDGDDLQYTLFFAREGEDVWIPLLKPEEKLTATSWDWDTSGVPAGYYVVKVVATDEQANDPKLALAHAKTSKPVLVDNDPPAVTLDVAAAKGGATAKGSVQDGFSQVGQIQYSVDGKPWKDIFPADLVFDEQAEEFSFAVDGLAAGSAHTLSVRAWDAARNSATAGAGFQVK